MTIKHFLEALLAILLILIVTHIVPGIFILVTYLSHESNYVDCYLTGWMANFVIWMILVIIADF